MFRSLRWRVPAFVCALIALIVTTLLLVTQREIGTTLVRAARDRAIAAAQQFSEQFGRAMRGNLEDNARLASDPALRAFVLNPNEETREAVLKVLAPRAPGLFRRVEIWSDAPARLLEISTPGKMASGRTVTFPSEPAPTQVGVSSLRADADLSYFDVTTEIHDGAAPPRRLGYLRRYGRVTFTGNLRNLIGDGAIVRVGNPGGTWTDMFVAASAPPTADPSSAIGEHSTPDGRQWIGGSRPIDHTSLVTWVGFPRDVIVAPAQSFMRRVIALALVSIAISVGLVALLSIRVSRRVRGLTDAADQLAAGDYSRRVPGGRRDEIGVLAEAFNTMADRVEHAHRALKATHERTQFALASARIGLWECETETERMTCSESIAFARGLAVESVPRTVDEFLASVHAADSETLRRLLRGRGIDGDTFETQYRIVRQDGAIRWVEARGRVQRNAAGRPVSVLGVSADITEQRQLESQLRQAQKMEAVGQLAGGVAHDFNNLLTAIMGHGSLALEALPADHPVREDVVEILKAGERAAGLTRQLLAFSRRQVMQPEVVGMNRVVSQVEKLLGRLIGEQIQIVLDLSASPDTVKVDPGQLEQVLVNLAVNARDAMPEGGTLTVATSTVRLDETYAREHHAVAPGDYVVVSVADTGTGMDAETQARLFEPFFTTKAAGKGTGLGLATVYGIVKQSGGFIYVYSELGRGTAFKVYLPLTSEQPSLAARTDGAAPKRGTETILVVEDDAHVRGVAARLLGQLGYRVLAASSGEEALSILERAGVSVDLVVSDVIMPGMTGPELYRQLSRRYPDLRVLFTSGYSKDAVTRHGVLEPGTKFLEKPYPPGVLARKVREALAS
jgi:signal transduction histidine kinase